MQSVYEKQYPNAGRYDNPMLSAVLNNSEYKIHKNLDDAGQIELD